MYYIFENLTHNQRNYSDFDLAGWFPPFFRLSRVRAGCGRASFLLMPVDDP